LGTPFHRVARGAFLPLALALFMSSPARAERDDRAAAVSALRDGNRLLEAGRAADALARFQEAFRLSGSAKLFYNIGQAHRDLPGHELEAYESFNRYLEQAQDAAPGTRAEAERMRSELRRKLSFLSVTTVPAGAQIAVDGNPRGTSPQTLTLSPGAHRVRLELEGYVPGPEETVMLAAGQTVSRNVELKRRPAALASPAPTAERAAPAPKTTPTARPAVTPAALAAGHAGEDDDDVDPTKLRAETAKPREPDEAPLYTRWWVWAGAGGLVAAAAVVLVATRGGVVHQCPTTTTGICDPLPPRN
jgi:tetratricopeptide (TPR) repeat protein